MVESGLNFVTLKLDPQEKLKTTKANERLLGAVNETTANEDDGANQHRPQSNAAPQYHSEKESKIVGSLMKQNYINANIVSYLYRFKPKKGIFSKAEWK